jgi:hypothetical protein
MATTTTPPAVWRPKYNPWIVALTVTLATFMEVLDTSIANVALPHIAGGLSASQDESTWVLTSYLVSNAIVLPISAWLSVLVGRKRFYMTCVMLFTISSFLCGLAPSLGMLVLFRVMQGLGGGGLATSEQSILADTFSLEKRGMAFAVYGRGDGARHWTHPGRLDHRQLHLALDFLYQRAGGISVAVSDAENCGRSAVHRRRAQEDADQSHRLHRAGADYSGHRMPAGGAR